MALLLSVYYMLSGAAQAHQLEGCMEYIIKYTGDILSLGYPTELLDAQFAIMELEARAAGRLLEYQQVSS